MKSLLVTLSMFIILLICIGFNCFFIHYTYGQMLEYSNTISVYPGIENQSIILEMKKYWDDKNSMISLSLSYRDISEISNAIDAVFAANHSNNEAELNINIEKLKNTIKSIIRLERFEIDNIL